MCKALHKKLLDRRIAIWNDPTTTEFNTHQVSRILKYIAKGFTVVVLRESLTFLGGQPQVQKIQYTMLPKDIQEYVLKPMLELHTEHYGPTLPEVYTHLGINTPDGHLVRDADYNENRY